MVPRRFAPGQISPAALMCLVLAIGIACSNDSESRAPGGGDAASGGTTATTSGGAGAGGAGAGGAGAGGAGAGGAGAGGADGGAGGPGGGPDGAAPDGGPADAASPDGDGSATSCEIPPRDCTGGDTFCKELIQFQPADGPGYVDYPVNGETAENQYRSHARRELVLLIQHAAAFVRCHGAALSEGNGLPIGLGDMSEADGSIPGTSIGAPGQPAGTHTDGTDIDVAHFQLLPPDNRIRPICPHESAGVSQSHCVSEPDNLDVQRTALFLGAILSSPRLRVVGVDGKVGPLVAEAISSLCTSGELPPEACAGLSRLAYEVTDGGRGWFYFHHHHMHISLQQ